jgi:hypothetical protein
MIVWVHALQYAPIRYGRAVALMGEYESSGAFDAGVNVHNDEEANGGKLGVLVVGWPSH